MRDFLFFGLMALLGFGVTTELPAAFITAGAVGHFTETSTNDKSGDLFSLTNTSDLDSGLRISSIRIDLADNLAFDVDNDRGSAFQIVSSLPGGSATASLSDALTTLTLELTSFDPGESLEFSIDVDGTMGQGSGQKQVMGHAFAGSTLTITYEGLDSPFVFSGLFQRREEGRVFPFEAVASISEQIAAPATIPNPEPSSWILFSLGLMGLTYVGMRRKRDK